MQFWPIQPEMPLGVTLTAHRPRERRKKGSVWAVPFTDGSEWASSQTTASTSQSWKDLKHLSGRSCGSVSRNLEHKAHIVISVTATFTHLRGDAFTGIPPQWFLLHTREPTVTMNKHTPELKSHFPFPTFQLAQGAQRPHAMATAPATTGTRGQESAAAPAASTGPRVSCACRADTASPAGVRFSALVVSMPKLFCQQGVSE